MTKKCRSFLLRAVLFSPTGIITTQILLLLICMWLDTNKDICFGFLPATTRRTTRIIETTRQKPWTNNNPSFTMTKANEKRWSLLLNPSYSNKLSRLLHSNQQEDWKERLMQEQDEDEGLFHQTSSFNEEEEDDDKNDDIETNQNLEDEQQKSDETSTDERVDLKFIERNKRWVVIVDDEEAIRLAVGDYIYDQGYQVTACADVEAFTELLFQPPQQTESSSSQPDTQTTKQQSPESSESSESSSSESSSSFYFPPVPDVIVSDIRMPGNPNAGIELTRMIRSSEKYRHVPVVLLTAKGLTSDRIIGYQSGANIYLPKPFAPEELLSIVDNVILRQNQMVGKHRSLVELQRELLQIKQVMQRNSQKVVQKTTVYLSSSQRETLTLLCQGYTNKEISDERGVSITNVNKVIQRLYKATQTQTRTELVRWAIKTGYVAAKR